MAEACEALDADNREAWRLFSIVVCRLTVDVPGLAGPMLARVIEDKSAEDAIDLLERLGLIYDTLYPAKTSQT